MATLLLRWHPLANGQTPLFFPPFHTLPRRSLTSRAEAEKIQPGPADVAELADALDSGSSALTGVEVRVLSSAPKDFNRAKPLQAGC